ncbi:MAG: response regulator [Bacteroidota bacterium]
MLPDMYAHFLQATSQIARLDRDGVVKEVEGGLSLLCPGPESVFGRMGFPTALQKKIAALPPGEQLWRYGVAIDFGPGESVFDFAWGRIEDEWFWLILELPEAARKAPQEHWTAQASAPVPPPVPDRVAVLIAEDNPFNLKVTQRQIDQMGFRSQAATNGKEVLEALEKAHYDVVLMDLNMPVMDGYEAFRAMRETLSPRVNETPVIAMSSSGLTAADPGFAAVLKKPLRGEMLKQTILRVIRSGQSGESGAPPDLVRLDYLREVTQSNRTLMIELLDIYLQEVPTALKQMQHYIATQKWRALRELAHKTKANFRYVGADQMFVLTDTMERYAASGSIVGKIPGLMLELIALAEPTATALQHLRTALAQPESPTDPGRERRATQ